LVEEINDELFEEYLNSEVKSAPKFRNIAKAIEYLRLPNHPATLTEFKEIIMDKWKLRDHDAVIRFLKSHDYVDNKLADLEFKGIDTKNLTNGYHKLKIIREMEAEFGISLWQPQAPSKADMRDEFYRLARTVFRTKLPKPQTPEDIVKFYGAIVKSATCRNFVNVSKGQVKINTDFVVGHLNLNGYKNVDRLGFCPEAMAHFGIESNTRLTGFVDASTLGLDA
jgi:hypothetical protein